MVDLSPGLRRGADGRVRCWWPGDDPLYVAYHDDEWGLPVTDDRALFEKLSLDGFQAGLSWITILRKRDALRAAFAGFDLERVARFRERDVQRLLEDAGIVRHRGKIEAVVANARATLELQEQGESLGGLVWSFAPAAREAALPDRDALPAVTPESTALSAALRQRGFRFVGPTTVYAFMQAVGLVNDHLGGCHRWQPVERARRRDRPPAAGRPASTA